MNLKSIFKLAVSISLPLLIGAIAGIFTSKAVPEWYASLNRPSFSPPNWVFGPVWTTLYVLMGISFYMIWKSSPGKDKNRAMTIYFIQLFFNFIWSFIFFYFKLIGWALADIIILWLLLAAMIVLFYRVKPAAAFMNIPYLLWVTFASVLNGAYFVLN